MLNLLRNDYIHMLPLHSIFNALASRNFAPDTCRDGWQAAVGISDFCRGNPSVTPDKLYTHSTQYFSVIMTRLIPEQKNKIGTNFNLSISRHFRIWGFGTISDFRISTSKFDHIDSEIRIADYDPNKHATFEDF